MAPACIRPPQIPSQPGAKARGKVACENGASHAQDCQAQHRQAGLPDNALVALGNAYINHTGQKVGQVEIGKNLAQDQQHHHRRRPRIRFDKPKQFDHILLYLLSFSYDKRPGLPAESLWFNLSASRVLLTDPLPAASVCDTLIRY